MQRLTSRTLCLIALLLCFILFGVAYWVEKQFGLAPCPLCMLQRIMIGGIAVVALIGAIHNAKRVGSIIYGIIGLIFSATGLGLAARQIWLQHQPTDTHAACLPGLSFIFQTMSFGKALKTILHGSTECGRVRWTFLHLSMPEWSAIAFTVLAIFMIILIFKKPQKPSAMSL